MSRRSSKSRFTLELENRNVFVGKYAEAYDVMCAANPAYEQNLSLFRRWIHDIELPRDATICDVGAGTGNYVLEIAARFPDAEVLHVDSDPVMNRTASRKYRKHRLANVRFQTCSVAEAEVTQSSLDALICVNALYAFGDHPQALSKFYSWLKPSGQLFLIDLGRPMKVGDWARYIIGSSLARTGAARTMRAFVRGRKAIGQNRRIRKEQSRGTYWLHSTESFREALITAGFSVELVATCYRDVCDFAICSKSMEKVQS